MWEKMRKKALAFCVGVCNNGNVMIGSCTCNIK